MIISLVLWNWLGGLVAGLIPAVFVFGALRRAQQDPDNVGKARTYLRFIAASHLFNHAVTVLGSLMLCVGSIDLGVPAWVAWAIFGIYFLFYRLAHIIDALTRLVKADDMPAASNM